MIKLLKFIHKDTKRNCKTDRHQVIKGRCETCRHHYTSIHCDINIGIWDYLSYCSLWEGEE